jgi:Concanavalin A-like lectin/glucanases superfamily
MRLRKLCVGTASFAVAVVATLTVVAPAGAAGYSSAVLADSPSRYWRLGEGDGAATAADASGHGVTLNYASTALLDLDAGIVNETDTSAAGDAGMIASLTPATNDVAPSTVEAWLRIGPSDGATFYTYYDGISRQYKVSVGSDGLAHASMIDTMNPNIGLVIDGPSSKPVADGFWHYVVVNFVTRYIYVDLVQGPPGQNPGSFRARTLLGASTTQVLPPTVNLGAPGFDGQLDEVAVYPSSLTTTQMTNHANVGGIGWDADVAGGEEAAPPGCFERGLFWKGWPNSSGALPGYTAFGSLNFITTTKQRNRCGSAPPAGSGKRPTFVTGQTVRIKLNGDAPGDYVEWGPVQYFCNASTTCWGLFFNFKLTTGAGPNDVCFKSFRAGQFLQLRSCTGPSATVAQALSTCTPTGTHGWKLQHVGTNWVGYFLCDTTTQNWLQVFSHPDVGTSSGWPDVEGFNQGYKCGTRTTTNCWKREGFMAETHSKFQWLNAAGAWNSVSFGLCRIDRSLRWDARVSVATPPISIQIFQNIRATGC